MSDLEDTGTYRIPPSMSAVYITDHFRWDEMACHSGEPTPDEVKPNLRRLCSLALEVIREAWEAPIIVVSGWRSKSYNFKIGGALSSQHVLGTAADIRPVSLGELPRFKGVVEQLMAKGKLQGVGGYGRYPGWIHVDVRQRKSDGSIARWDGKGVGSEMT